MKKTVLHFIVLVALMVLGSRPANAQVTGIVGYYNDSSYTYCNTPAPVSGFGFLSLMGNPLPNDSLTFYINYGDGTDTTYKVLTQQQYTFTINHTYMTTGMYQINIIVTNTNMVADTFTGQTYNITNTCSALTGLAWIDANANCTYDVGEQYLAGHFMKITDTANSIVYYAAVDTNGVYNIEVPDNFTYQIELANIPGSIVPVCPVTGIAYEAVSGTGTFTNNFGYECTTGNTDFSVAGWANLFRPGHTRHFVVTATTNNFCATYPATVTLVLHPLLTYASTTYGPAPSVAGNVLTWNVSSLSQLNSLYSYMMVTCDSFAVLGDTLCNTLYITYTGTDSITVNDTADICRLVSNSYDPNDKSVFPAGDGALGLIPNGTTLSYLVNFQNTGNDTAYDVVIVDSINSNLNINTFQLLEASHPVNVTWLAGNVINFRFENIYLPDSNTNEPLSHGFVSYKIDALPGLADGATITNTAHIYFDFNPAIVTNTTLNTIDIPTSVRNISNGSLTARVFPNPANNELAITTDNASFSAQLFDMVGRPVATSVTNNGKAVMNTSSLASGMYILHINAGGKEMTTKIHIQH